MSEPEKAPAVAQMSFDEVDFTRQPSWVRRAGLARPWLVILAGCILATFAFIAVFGVFLQPYGHTQYDLLNILAAPSFGGEKQHLLGTDDLGRDVLSRWMFGLRVSAGIAVLGASIGAVLGTVLGMVAARARGLVDEAIMMLVDVQASMPFIIFALAIIAFAGGSLWVLVLVVGVDGWERYARLARGIVLSVNQAPFVAAVRATGLPDIKVYSRHIFPNILPALLVQFSINLPGTILLETSISFLGLGVQPPLTSLGQMLGEGRDYLLIAPWISLTAGLTIFAVTLSISIIGDWLRDRLDPSLR